MSGEGLKKAVLDKASAEAEQIVSRARTEAEGIVSAARERAERAAVDTIEKARRDAEQKRSRAISSLEREVGLAALEQKNRLLEEVFLRAARQFTGIPARELKEVYRKELDEINLDGATVQVSRGARGEFESILGGRARVGEDASIEAGYVIVSKDFRLDKSLAARLEDVKADMRSELARMLFGDAT
jgi:V/A-type H+-transporting ATPase subunit E